MPLDDMAELLAAFGPAFGLESDIRNHCALKPTALLVPAAQQPERQLTMVYGIPVLYSEGIDEIALVYTPA